MARNFGQPSAVMAALNHAKGDYVVCGDDDGQTPFSELPKFFQKIEEGYDAVEAKFIQHEKRSLFRKFGTFVNESMQSWLIDKPRGVVLTTFWVIRRFVADEMCKYPNSHPYLGGLILRSTKNVCNVEVKKNERLRGKSGYNIKKWLNFFEWIYYIFCKTLANGNDNWYFSRGKWCFIRLFHSNSKNHESGN